MRNSNPIFLEKSHCPKFEVQAGSKHKQSFPKFWANQKAQKKFEHFKRKIFSRFKEKNYSPVFIKFL